MQARQSGRGGMEDPPTLLLQNRSWSEALSGPGGTTLAAGLQSLAFPAGLALASAPPGQSAWLALPRLRMSYQLGLYAADF